MHVCQPQAAAHFSIHRPTPIAESAASYVHTVIAKEHLTALCIHPIPAAPAALLCQTLPLEALKWCLPNPLRVQPESWSLALQLQPALAAHQLVTYCHLHPLLAVAPLQHDPVLPVEATRGL